MTNEEEFEAYLLKSDQAAEDDERVQALLEQIWSGIPEDLPPDPWRRLDGIRRIGVMSMAAIGEEDRKLMLDNISHFVPSVVGMDIDITDPNQLRAYLVGIGMAWRLAADEFARCQSATPHTFDHLNASLTRMMIALEPVVLAAGVRPPLSATEEDAEEIE